MQTLREELDAANKKIDRYAHLVATLSEEIDNLRRSICHDCKMKFVPSYAPVGSSSNEPGPFPSLSRRIVSGRHIHTSSGTNAWQGSPNTSISTHPTTTRQNQTESTISVPHQPSDTPRKPLTTLVDGIQPDWSVSHNPKIKQALLIDLGKTIKFPARVFCVKFSPNGKYLAVGLNDESGRTYIYDVEKGLNVCSLADPYLKDQPMNQIVWCVQFSPDNKFIATASSDERIRIWEIARKRTRATFASRRTAVITLCFSPNSRFIVAGDGDHSARIWSLRDGSSKALIEDAYNICSVIFSPDGRHIASVDFNGWLRIWDARTGHLLDAWKGHTREALCLAFTPDGNGLVCASGDAILRYWDVSSLAVMETGRGRVMGGTPGQRFQQIRTFKGHTSSIRSVSFSSDYRWIVSSSRDKSIRIWDPRTAEWQCTLRGHDAYVRTVDFSPAGKYLASGGEDCLVRLWRYREV